MLLARPATDISGLSGFLAGFRADFGDYVNDPVPLPPATQVCKVAGQLCYMSFSARRTKNSQAARYFANILEQGHGSVLEHANFTTLLYGISRSCCYDPETEVLTESGWKSFPSVSYEDSIACLDPASGNLVYDRPQEIFAYDYVGPMYRVKNREIDLLVTPNHRMFVRPHDTRAAPRGKQPWIIAQASDIAGKRMEYKRDATWVGDYPTTFTVPAVPRDRRGKGRRWFGPLRVPSDAFARFLGYFVTEGHLHHVRGSSYFVGLTQNYGPVFDDMMATVRQLGFTPFVRPLRGTRAAHISFASLPLYEWLRNAAYVSGEKRVPDAAKRWSVSLLSHLWVAAIAGDGSVHHKSGHEQFYSSSARLADDMQEIALKIGKSATIWADRRMAQRTVVQGDGRVVHFAGTKPSWVVSVSAKRQSTPLVNHGGRPQDGWVSYAGRVYCLRVPSGVIYVRRNGKPVWCGNSHELVRHRAGFAYSQLSQRFVGADLVRFVERPEFQAVPGLHAAFEARIDEAARQYAEMTEALRVRRSAGDPAFAGLRRTDQRKAVQQAARALLPNETEAPIVVTGNVRAWRHVIAMRTDLHAEPEIRRAMHRVWQVLVAEEPILFGDFTEKPLPDGTVALHTPHPKV